MSVAKLRKILSLSFSLVIVFLFPLTIYASTATPSEAWSSGVYSNFVESLDEDVLIASSNNAMPMDDFVALDDFDVLDVPAFMSDGGNSSSTIDFTGSKLNLRYYDMMNRVKDVSVNLDADGYGSISRPSDFVKSIEIEIRLFKNNLPSAGKYNMNVHFGSNTGGFTYTDAFVWSGKNNKNAGMQQQQTSIDFSQGSGDFNISTIVEIGNIDYLNVGAYSSGIIPPVGGFFTVSFTKVSGSVAPDVTTAGGSYSSSDALADNTAQQVEQGETIIELIKNTIQTISSQLTAFWNQLAGEFTNLYAKMTQQHYEQLQADRENTDDIIAADDANTNKVTTAIESHGNFIIEGLKKLFIPSDEYFKSYFDDLYSWFSERFGFLSFPIDLLLVVIDIFVNSSQTDCVLVLPSFTIMENLLWPEMSFNLTEFLNTNFSFLVVAIKTVTSIYLVMAFVQLCEEKWNEVMMN